DRTPAVPARFRLPLRADRDHARKVEMPGRAAFRPDRSFGCAFARHQGSCPMNPHQLKRRQFLKAASIGVAASAIAKPSIAETRPAIRCRLTSSFPKSVDTHYGPMGAIAKFVAGPTHNQS